mgnify:CR=1 FL=1
MSSDSDGLTKFMGTILAVAIVAVAIASCRSLPVGNGVTWDNTAEVQRNATEQLRISQENETERLRIMESADTQRTWAIALASVAVIGGAIYGTVQLAKHNASRKPATVVYQIPAHVVNVQRRLPPADGYRTEYIDGDWWFVSDKRQDCMTVDEARRLTG